ncbi:retrovirus-related pol polyprotein from transposon TNT 1-94 [Tanacetum coccineum]
MDGDVPSVIGASSNIQMELTNTGIGLSTASDGTRNKVGPVDDTSTVMKGVTPSMIDMTVITSVSNALGKSSYANITGKPCGKKVNIRTLFTPGGNGIDVVFPVDSIRVISERFANTSYGFFLGKKNGPWFIRNNPLILKKWHPDENLLKEDVSTVPVWVKLHGVPVTTFSKDSLSAIATKLGTLLMLDSYTSDISSTTPIIDKIKKFEELLTSGQVIFVDKAGNPLKKVKFLGEYDSEDEVASVDNDMARSMASERVGFGTQSLLE